MARSSTGHLLLSSDFVLANEKRKGSPGQLAAAADGLVASVPVHSLSPGRLVGRLSGWAYLATVMRAMPNRKALARSEGPHRFASGIAFHQLCCVGSGALDRGFAARRWLQSCQPGHLSLRRMMIPQSVDGAVGFGAGRCPQAGTGAAVPACAEWPVPGAAPLKAVGLLGVTVKASLMGHSSCQLMGMYVNCHEAHQPEHTLYTASVGVGRLSRQPAGRDARRWRRSASCRSDCRDGHAG